MKFHGLLLLVVVALLGGCVSYSLVAPGSVTVGSLEVRPQSAWSSAPGATVPAKRKDAVVWTQDGLALDRLIIIPAVPDGEPILKEQDEQEALPRFEADMLPNELAELTESSLVKLLGEGNAAVRTTDLRPHRYGDSSGILLDLEASVTDGPDYKGLAGAFIANNELYVLLYVAADPYYYGKHLPEAESIIKTARLALGPEG